VQAAFYRSSFDKPIQLYGKYDAVRQERSIPVRSLPLRPVEGTDNFQDKYAPAVGARISRRSARARWVRHADLGHNTPRPSTRSLTTTIDGAHTRSSEAHHVNRNTTYIGIGGRMRLGSLLRRGRIAVRVQGYAPDQPGYGVSVEKRVGAHMFSLTFTNTFATTFAQLARGGAANSLFLGFNLGRKFF
jgi:hypothetical protein